MASELEKLVAELRAVVAELDRLRPSVVQQAKASRESAARIAAAGGATRGGGAPAAAIAQFQRVARLCDELTGHLQGATAAADHFSRRVLSAGSPGGVGGAAARPGAGPDPDPEALDRTRYHLRANGTVARNRKVDSAGHPVPKLVWDEHARAYVKVEETDVVRARYDPGLASYAGYAANRRDAIANALALRAMAKIEKDVTERTHDVQPSARTARLLRAAWYNLTLATEQLGNLAGDSYVESAYANPNSPPRKLHEGTGSGTFDQVWQATEDSSSRQRYVVVECKGGSSRLGTRRIANTDYQQGTLPYFQDIVRNMADNGSEDDQRLARRLRRALIAGLIDYVHVHALVHDDGEPRLRVGRFDIRLGQPGPTPPDQEGSPA